MRDCVKMLSEDDGKYLLKVARDAIETYVK